MVSMAIAATAAGLSGLAVAELKSARGSLGRIQAEYRLAGAQRLAAETLLKNDVGGRLRFQLSGGAEGVDVLAEPEAVKVSYAAAAKLDDRELARLDVQDPAQLREKLMAAEAAHDAPRPVADLDAAPVWRECAASVVSPYGSAEKFSFAKANPPNAHQFSWRLGEVWRIRAATADGWADDRIVRFTGDPSAPAAIVQRSFSRGSGGEQQCENILDGL
jgi:hypothetical protein